MLTLRLVAAARAVSPLTGEDPTDSLRQSHPRQLEKAFASIIAALAALAIVLLAYEILGRLAPALALGVVFAFGTGLWSTASRGLWQHGPVVLLTAVAMTWLVRQRRTRDWRWSALAGVPLGIAFVVRPSIAVVLALTAAVLLFTDYKAAAGSTVAAAVVIAPSIALNIHLYGTLIVPVYLPGRGPVVSGLSPTLAEGIEGTMISPGAGCSSSRRSCCSAFSGCGFGDGA